MKRCKRIFRNRALGPDPFYSPYPFRCENTATRRGYCTSCWKELEEERRDREELESGFEKELSKKYPQWWEWLITGAVGPAPSE